LTTSNVKLVMLPIGRAGCERRCIDIGDPDFSAGCREGFRHGTSDAAGPGGNEDTLHDENLLAE
jgi:hypothetical protein